MEGRHFAYVLRLYMERNKMKAQQEKMKLAKERKGPEKDDPLTTLTKDINAYWRSLVEIHSNEDRWRKIEDSGILASLRVCSKIKGNFDFIKAFGLNAKETKKIASVFDELTILQKIINDSFIFFKKKSNEPKEDTKGNEKEEQDESEEGQKEAEVEEKEEMNKDDECLNKYYKNSYIQLLELWAGAAIAACETIAVLKEGWDDKSEFLTTAKSIAQCCETAGKSACVTADVGTFPIPNEIKDIVLEATLRQCTRASNALSITLEMLDHTQREDNGPTDALLEMVSWTFLGLDHVSSTILIPMLAEMPNECMEFQERFKEILQKMFDKLTSVFNFYKISNETNKNTKDEEKSDEEAAQNEGKETAQGQESEQSNKIAEDGASQDLVDCMAAIKKLGELKSIFINEVVGSGRLHVCLEDPLDPDTKLIFRPEQYTEIAGCGIGPCEMKDRSKWLSNIGISEDKIIVSDIYVISHGPAKTASEFEIQFNATPLGGDPDKEIFVYVKSGGSWKVQENVECFPKHPHVQLSFKTNEIEAFVAYMENTCDEMTIKPEGCTFTSPKNPSVFINFPEGTVDEELSAKIRFMKVNKKEANEFREKHPEAFTGLVDISDVVDINPQTPVDAKKNTTAQVTLEGDDSLDGRDTHLVVIRYNETTTQVLDSSQCRINQVEPGLYKIENRGIWSVGLARIKKIFVNMRETVKREFLVMIGKVQLCNIVTFVDSSIRDQEKGLITFWVEILEKTHLQETIEDRAKDGLIEVKSSRSRDLALKQNESLNIHLEGQVRVVGAPLTERFTMTYLHSASNHVAMPLEIKRDHDKPAHAGFLFRDVQSPHGVPFHSVIIPISDILEIPSEMLQSAITSKYSNSNSAREEQKRKEEAAIHLLSQRSLMCLAREISQKDCTKLGEQLGLSPFKIKKIYEQYESDLEAANFRIICEWRGKSVRSAMVSFLENSLRAVGCPVYAELIQEAVKFSRGLRKTDFDQFQGKK